MAESTAKAKGRAVIQERVDAEIDSLVDQLLVNAKSLTAKKLRCPKCKTVSEFSVIDAKTSTDAIDKLIALGYGRQTGAAKAEGFILERRIVRPVDELREVDELVESNTDRREVDDAGGTSDPA